MSDRVIRVEGLGKEYQIGGPQQQYSRFGEQLAALAIAPIRRAAKLMRGRTASAGELDKSIWALRGVSFEIRYGEVVGIVGRNGAGKSTLLKLLSRITEPTEGFAEIRGRVGSLLEVGTGFHPELTGRENVFLNGAILGMKRHEIQRNFDEIVAFAELDQFIDTPVKHYSSGMYVRLAFAVAAHLETELLLVDEVLAVGDLAFQKRCLGKIQGVAGEGRTVLFVSHNVGLMQTLCTRGILLHQSHVVQDGPIDETIQGYMGVLEQAHTEDLTQRTDRLGDGNTRLVSVEIRHGSNPDFSVLRTGEAARFEFCFSHFRPGLACLFVIQDQLGQRVAMFQSDIAGDEDSYSPEIGCRFVCDFDQLLLLPGHYRVNVRLHDRGGLQDFIETAAMFDVESGQVDGRPMDFRPNGFAVTMPHRWRMPAELTP